MAVTVSEKPWSDYTKADYTPEQWHAACLIHQHDGAPTSKDQCKLPVRTPTGTLNRNGVHAAAGALAGARGGVNASSEEKAAAMTALRRYYNQLEEDPPPSLGHISELDEFLAHHGVKGQQWGVRRSKSELAARPSEDKLKVTQIAAKIGPKKNTSALSNQELQALNQRLNMEQQYSKLSYKPSNVKKGMLIAGEILAVGVAINRTIDFVKSPAGQGVVKIFESTIKKKVAE